MKFFKKSSTYFFHLRSGQSILVKGVKNLKIKWDNSTTQLISYELSFVDPSYNTLFHVNVNDIVAIEKV